jgi:hypothetical protein
MVSPTCVLLCPNARRAHAASDLHNVYCSQNVIGVIKSRIMRWEVHVVRMWEIKEAYTILVGRLQRQDHSWNLGIEMKLMVKYISNYVAWAFGLHSAGTKWRPAVNSCARCTNLRVP